MLELVDAVVDAFIVGHVSVIFFDEGFDHLDHIGDMIGSGRVMLSRLNVEYFEIFEKSFFVDRGEVIEAHARLLRIANRFVIDISQVHNLSDFEIIELDDATQEVFENISAEIADVGVVVYRGSASIKTNFTLVDRGEDFGLARHGV